MRTYTPALSLSSDPHQGQHCAKTNKNKSTGKNKEPTKKSNDNPSNEQTGPLISKFSLFPGLGVIIGLKINKGFTESNVGNL